MAFNLGNKFSLGNTGGAPPHFKTPEELMKACEGYFNHIDQEQEHATITGLKLYLGFSSASSFTDYCNRSDEFSYIVKRAKMIVEHAYELSLHEDKPTGAIFALKQMGWKDRTEQDLTVSGGLEVLKSTTSKLVRPNDDNTV